MWTINNFLVRLLRGFIKMMVVKAIAETGCWWIIVFSVPMHFGGRGRGIPKWSERG